jgi:hypothetical protein
MQGGTATVAQLLDDDFAHNSRMELTKWKRKRLTPVRLCSGQRDNTSLIISTQSITVLTPTLSLRTNRSELICSKSNNYNNNNNTIVLRYKIGQIHNRRSVYKMHVDCNDWPRCRSRMWALERLVAAKHVVPMRIGICFINFFSLFFARETIKETYF